MLTLRHLEIFCSIARTESVTQAATALHLSQPAASMALAELERLLGGRLFDRLGRALRLNERGRVLLPRAAAVLAQVDEIEGQLRGQGGQLEGTLAIGASSTIANYLMPALVGRFGADHPGVRITMEVGNSATIVAKVADLSIDVGFVAGDCGHPDLENSRWRQDRLAVFAAPDHPLAQRKRICLRHLEEERWILREPGSGTRSTFERAVAGHLDHFDVALELGQSEAVKHAVEEGWGVSCLSHYVIARELEAGHLVELATPFLDLRRNLYTLVHRQRHIGNILRSFLDEVRQGASPRE